MHPMIDQQSQCDAALLRRYLNGELSAGEESDVIQHLDKCAHCQQEIESLAASAADWDDVRRLLTPDASAPLAVARPVTAGPAVSAGETGASDLAACSTNESRLDFLAPTDDPFRSMSGDDRLTHLTWRGHMAATKTRLKAVHSTAQVEAWAWSYIQPLPRPNGPQRQPFDSCKKNKILLICTYR
jgi:hypothetical protein